MFNLEKWMSPAHCLPDHWFRYYVAICGLAIFITYFIFSYQLEFRLKDSLKRILPSKFPRTLASVFMLCAIIHLAHSFSYIHQYSKLINLLYPLLIYYHFRLIYLSRSAIKMITQLKTEKEYISITDRNELLENQILNFTKKSTEEIQNVFKDKHIGSNKVYFKDFDSLVIGQKIEISKGCFVVARVNNEAVKVLDCYMNDGVVVKNHVHIDSEETFQIVKGVVVDNLDLSVRLEKGDKRTQPVGIPHEPRSIGSTHLIITIKKVI